MTAVPQELSAEEPDEGDPATPGHEGTGTEPLPEYKFDPAHVAAASVILDVAFTNLHDGPVGWGIVDEAAAEHPGLDPALARELSFIGARDLCLGGIGEVGCEFFIDGGWLPDPKTVSNDVVELWRGCIDTVTSPGAVARLEELLIARGEGNLGRRARNAATSYLASVGDKDEDFSTTIHLARAWTIARQFNVPDVEDLVLDELVRRVESISPQHPGSLLPMLAILCRKPSNTGRAADLRAAAGPVLIRLAATFTREYLAREVADLRLSLVQPGPAADEERVQIRRDQLAALRLATVLTDMHPAVRQFHLATAAEFATRHNFKEDLKQICAELESIPVEDLGLIHFSDSTPIARYLPEIEMHPFTRGHVWQDGLSYFLHTGPPTGGVEQLRTSASSGRTGLVSIFPTLLLGHGGLPRATLGSDEEEVAHQMAAHSKVMAETLGSFHAEGLRRIYDRYGAPTQGELESYFIQEYKCDPAGAHILAKAYQMYWNGEYVEAVHLVIPAAEAAARRLLRELDEGIYQVQVGKSVGQYPGLRVLLEELDELVLDPSWSWFLNWLFLGPGLNLRNDVAHGFIVSIGPVYTTLVLRAASLLITTSTSIDGQHRVITMPGPPSPRPGLRGIGDRLIATASTVLLRGHLRLEALRRLPERIQDSGPAPR